MSISLPPFRVVKLAARQAIAGGVGRPVGSLAVTALGDVIELVLKNQDEQLALLRDLNRDLRTGRWETAKMQLEEAVRPGHSDAQRIEYLQLARNRLWD